MSPSAFQDYLIGRLEGRRGPAWLDGQTLEQASRATEMLGAAMEFGTEFNPGLLTTEEWDLAGRAGWTWTSKGVSGIRAAFEDLQRRGPIRGKSSSRGPGKAFGSLYRWLANMSVQTDPGPIRALLRQHILETETIPPRSSGSRNERRSSAAASQRALAAPDLKQRRFITIFSSAAFGRLFLFSAQNSLAI